MNNKRGISLIMLVITIIILAILVLATVTGTTLATNNAKKVGFAEDLVSVEDNMRTLVAIDPLLSVCPTVCTHEQIFSYADISGSRVTLRNEMVENGEVLSNDDTQSKFRIIDLAALGASKTDRGMNNGDATDVYIYSTNTGYVYYIKGVKIGNATYHSLTEDLIDTTNITTSSNISQSNTSAEQIESMRVVKNTNDYTNRLELTIETANRDGAGITYLLKIDSIQKTITLNNGKYLLGVNNNFTAADLADKTTATLYKKSGSTVLATATINISNLDVVPPRLTQGSVTATKKSGNIYINAEAIDTGSGIDAYYIDYMLRYRSSGIYAPIENQIENYYSDMSGTNQVIKDYLKAQGEKSKDGLFATDNSLYEYRIVAVDKVGNISTYVTKTLGYNAIKIPDGFYYVGGDLSTGIVISDNKVDENKGTSYDISRTLMGNQFVWIPVYTVADLRKVASPVYTDILGVGMTDLTYTMPVEIKSKIASRGGFYVARYEMCGNTADSKFSVANKPVMGTYSYNAAKNLATSLYPDKTQIQTDLMYGEVFDRILSYIGEDGTDVISGTNWGNTLPDSGTSQIRSTAYNAQWCRKNIYDICGNAWEWTQDGGTKEGYGEIRVHRGGWYGQNISTYGVSTRRVTNAINTVMGPEASFRVMLYFK